MLVLSRKKDEDIVINGNIRVIVVEFRGGDKVRLGIDAPPEVSVHRREVQEAIEREAGAAEPREPSVITRREVEWAKTLQYLGEKAHSQGNPAIHQILSATATAIEAGPQRLKELGEWVAAHTAMRMPGEGK